MDYFRYDPVTQKWSFTSSIPRKYIYYGVEAWNSKMYLLGGYLENKTFCNDMFIYNTKTDKWESGPPMAVSRAGHAVSLPSIYSL